MRDIEFMKPLFSAADPTKVGDLFKKFRGALFPEHRFDDIRYIEKGRRIFEEMQKLDLKIYV